VRPGRVGAPEVAGAGRVVVAADGGGRLGRARAGFRCGRGSRRRGGGRRGGEARLRVVLERRQSAIRESDLRHRAGARLGRVGGGGVDRHQPAVGQRRDHRQPGGRRRGRVVRGGRGRPAGARGDGGHRAVRGQRGGQRFGRIRGRLHGLELLLGAGTEGGEEQAGGQGAWDGHGGVCRSGTPHTIPQRP